MAKKTSDEFAIDLTSIKKFFSTVASSKSKAWLTVLLILIPMFFSIYFRAYSYDLPVTDDWAKNSVFNSIRSQIGNEINKQYPNLPAQNKNKLIDEQVAEFLQTQGQAVNAQIEAVSNNLKKSFQDETGQTYLLAIDPYVYFRYARNLLNNGYMGDVLVDGKSFDNHKVAPFGGFTRGTFHPYFELYFHKFMSIFTDNSLMKNVFFVPILLSALAVIPAFFIAKRRIGFFGGFVAAMIVAVHPAFIGRTAGGFADTDAYNVLFPLLIAWFFIEGFETTDMKKRISYLGLSGLFVGVYSFAWSGWWYIFDFLLGVVIAYSIYSIIKSFVQKNNFWNDELKSSLITLVLFLFFSGFFVSLIVNFSTFDQFFNGPLSFKVIKQASKPNLWPNVYTTVAELNPASINSIISQLGGKLMFLLAGLGVVLTLIKNNKVYRNDLIIISLGVIVYLSLTTNWFVNLSPIAYLLTYILPVLIGLLLLLKDKRGIDIKYALFLTIWFIGTIYASTKGTRFVLLMVPAFGIAVGVAIGMIHKTIANWLSKEFEFNKKIVSGIIMILLLLILINPIKAAHNTSKGEIPSMNDAWWETLTKIKDSAAKDAIITSWWDFGHWFKTIADRAVTFDGGSQNRPQAHWVGKILMSDSEEQSLSLLRMLDCGANKAFDEINKKYDDTEISVDMVYEIISKNKENTEIYLFEKGFSEEEITNITGYTHCTPPEAYFITSGDMVGKAGVWSHFGSWNFDRSFIYNNIRNKDYQESIDLLINRFNYTEEQASDYYYEVQSLASDEEVNSWIAPWPNYATPSLRGCVNESEIATCNIGLGVGQSNIGHSVVIQSARINLSNPEDTTFLLSFIDRNTGLSVGQQSSKPNGLVLAGETIEYYALEEAEFDLDLVFDSINNKALVVNPKLSQSTFTKLFFLEGRYTTHFEKFSDITSVTGSKIIVWKVLW